MYANDGRGWSRAQLRGRLDPPTCCALWWCWEYICTDDIDWQIASAHHHHHHHHLSLSLALSLKAFTCEETYRMSVPSLGCWNIRSLTLLWSIQYVHVLTTGNFFSWWMGLCRFIMQALVFPNSFMCPVHHGITAWDRELWSYGFHQAIIFSSFKFISEQVWFFFWTIYSK